MSKSLCNSIVKVSLPVLLVISLCLIPSCKKSSPQPPVKGPEQPAADISESKAGDTEVKAPNAPSLTEHELPNVPAAEEVKTPKDANAPKLVPIELKLPKRTFVGTPQDMRVPNLEKPLGKARPPFLAPVGTKNVALGKPVSSSDEEPIIGELELITDDDKEAADGCYVELGPFLQHVTIDLKGMYEIYAIVFWHYHKQARVYYDVIVQVADDPDFIVNVRTLFNNDIDNSAGLGVGKDMYYTETHEGKLIDAKGQHARYVRLYSNGNNGNDLNHYIEVAVYGKPVE